MWPSDVLAALGARSDGRSGSWRFRCPGHNGSDWNGHAWIGDIRGEAFLKLCCHSHRCDARKIMESVGMRVSDLYRERGNERRENRPQRTRARVVAEYDYLSEDGELLYQVVRLEPKSFRQRRTCPQSGGWIWDVEGVRKVLYRLPELLASPRRVCWVVEGEKDVHTLESLGLLATTAAGGAGRWLDEYAAQLGERPVCVIPDADRVGLAHADAVAGSLVRAGLARSVRVLAPLLEVEHADVTDWLFALPPSQQRRAREVLITMYENTKAYRRAA